MKKKIALTFIITLIISKFASAASVIESQVATNSSRISQESSTTDLTPEELVVLKKLAEKEKLTNYTGVIGTAPVNKTISATGASIEETPSGPQVFIFWTQTLANGFYYEGRLYGKYNTQITKPIFSRCTTITGTEPRWI